ncbi:MAG: hypothetical protein HY706_04520 [Candidatus Hydrogenedentes bacterium]|nr:hypothetical protein [Candidatus Hydrogenedentota bacterium]
MPSLVENVLSIEEQADQLVAEAQRAAKDLERQAEVEVDALRRELASGTDQRVAAYRQEAEARHRQALATAEAEFQAALCALEGIPQEVIRRQVDRIVSRLRDS